MPDTLRAEFDLCGGHAALDLVNTLEHRYRGNGPNELLVDYRDLLRFARQDGILSDESAARLERSVKPSAAGRALRAARNLRESLAEFIYARLDGHPASLDILRALERHFQESTRHQSIGWSEVAADGRLLCWSRAGFEEEAELPVWIIAESAARLLTSPAAGQVRACDASTCRWLFLDTSKNHTRRWCNMKVCGNRMKARRFQSRRDRAEKTSRERPNRASG